MPTSFSPTLTQEEVLSLKEVFSSHFPVGTILSRAVLRGHDPLSEEIACRHFGAFTAENSMKPEAVQPGVGAFNFAEADRLVELAERCGAVAVGHTLLWHQQTPKWFFEGENGAPVTRDLALERMRGHINAVAGRYKGRIKEWDVVNEAISDVEGVFLRPSPWLDAIGEDYIAQAFRMAHEADPNAILIYNDYNIETPAKRDKTLRLLKSLLDAGVPIHAVGIQGHWRTTYSSLADAEAALEAFASLGLKVMITEMDIGVLPTNYQGAEISTREDEGERINPYIEALPDDVAQYQADYYREFFELFFRFKAHIGRVTLWGVHDGFSWLNDFPVRGRTDHPLLFDREGNPKAAFFAVVEAAQAQSARESETHNAA